MSAYAALNPFVSTSVGENDLWKVAFPDVPGIHAAPFAVLRQAVDQVRAQRRSLVRFVRGAGGSGKSHLFARLRLECADSIFYAYAPNPPLQPEALESFILSRLVGSLRHPARSVGGSVLPYSQLRLLAYALLKPVIEQNLTLLQLHETWVQIGLEERKELIHEAVLLLEADHPMVPRSVLRCLLNVLREDKEHLAAQWLSGAAYLTEAELKYLNVPEPLARSETGLVIQLFGKLATQAGAPVVLVLDQLDLVTTPAQFDEIQRLLFMLIDQSENWLVLIGLVAERFAAWDAALTQALRGRIGIPDAQAPLGFRLPVLDMLPVMNEQKRALLACRLSSPALAQQRSKDGITSPVHPLLEADISMLTTGGAIFPRHLLAAAAELYTQRCTGAVPNVLPQEVVAAVRTTPPPVPMASPVVPVATPFVVPAAVSPPLPPLPVPAPSVAAKASLAEKIDVLLQQAVTTAQADPTPPGALDLSERARDLIELMAVPPVSISEGDMRKGYENFDGSDRWFEWGGGKIRLITTDSVRSSLIAVLERIKDSSGDTLLLRNAHAAVSGQLTLELLTVFKDKNAFHHLSAAESAVLTALGRILAAQREGAYDQLDTERPATRENVLAALRNHPLVRGIRLWEVVQKVHAPKQTSVLASIARPPMPVAKPVARPPAPPVAKPPTGVPRPPMSKLPPPSQENAA